MKICSKEKCCGCFACQNICPRKAVEMMDNYYGVFPDIDDKLCVKCDMCRTICNGRIKFNDTIKCFSGYSNDNKIHTSSSSGGIAFELSKHVIKSGGVVYGVSSYTDSDGDISFLRVDKLDNLYKLQGSKYTHAYIKKIYNDVKNDLKNSIKVLFIGTPCQVAGLKKIVGDSCKNLITVDIVCHGVIPQKVLKLEIGKTFDYINFRGENGFCLIAKNNGKLVYKKNRYESDYYELFLSGYAYRESCYNCLYAQKKRVGDITLGDFWGKEDYSKKNGISLILVNTKLGENFLSNQDNISLFEEKIDNAYINNDQLLHPTKKKENNDTLVENIRLFGIKKAMKKNNVVGYYILKIKGKIKKIIDLIRHILK